MNMKRFIFSAIAILVFVFLFEFLVHGVLLQGIYMETAHLWRTQEESPMIFMFLSQLGFSLMAAFIFTRHFEAKGMGEGVRYGLMIGLLLGSIQVGTYCYMPIPGMLTAAWVLAALVKGLGSGVIASLVYRK